MTKAERAALREQMAGPKVEWQEHKSGLEWEATASSDDYWSLGAEVRFEEGGKSRAGGWCFRTSDNEGYLLKESDTLYPTADEAKLAAESALADHLFPPRRAVLDLLDWADRAGEWARGLGASHWAAGIGDGLCGLCPALVPGKHHPDCPLASPEFAELFGEGASPNAELVERTSRLSVFLATLYASVERALAERLADGPPRKESDSQ